MSTSKYPINQFPIAQINFRHLQLPISFNDDVLDIFNKFPRAYPVYVHSKHYNIYVQSTIGLRETFAGELRANDSSCSND